MDNKWFMGFLEGEGSFIDSPRKASKDDEKYYPRFVFSITQKERGVLMLIKEFLSSGNIRSRVNPQADKWQLHVEDKESLFLICKFLDLQEWFTETKYRQYQEWKVKIIKWFESGYNKRQYRLVEELLNPKRNGPQWKKK